MGRVLVCADLHGRGDLWDEIKEFLQPDDVLYMLGDAGDRGKDSWRVLKEAVTHPQVKYILGNHDVMFLDCLAHKEDSEWIWFNNGGRKTWKGAKHDPEMQDIVDRLKQCPYHDVYISKSGKKIYLNHSGCVSTDPELEIWDRIHYKMHDDISTEYDIIVHGHTPIELMIQDLMWHPQIKINWEYGHACHYLEGTKINIDCGAYWDGFTILLDLDTFEEHIIGEVMKDKVF